MFDLSPQRQAIVSVLLMAVIPSLTSFYLGHEAAGENISFPFSCALAVGMTALIAYAGFNIIKKYPDNISQLNRYIGELTSGNLPERISLLKTEECSDLKYIEKSFNQLLEDVIKAEHHRAMVESLSVLCTRLSEPAQEVDRYLHVLERHIQEDADIQIVRECLKDIAVVNSTINKIFSSKEFKEAGLHPQRSGIQAARRLSSSEFAQLIGLAVSCPFTKDEADCPLGEIRRMPLKKRLNSIHDLSDEEARRIIAQHCTCSEMKELAE
ncbi:MAG: hypothetical protein KJN67_01070 [Pontiella sp.]|nr:hypothetical protein [Pontiella sp.]NNJ71525.1 hypothetical protein [Kiritimatiellales bacterium]